MLTLLQQDRNPLSAGTDLKSALTKIVSSKIGQTVKKELGKELVKQAEKKLGKISTSKNELVSNTNKTIQTRSIDDTKIDTCTHALKQCLIKQ